MLGHHDQWGSVLCASATRAALHPGAVGPCSPSAHHPATKRPSFGWTAAVLGVGDSSSGTHILRGGKDMSQLVPGAGRAELEVGWPLGTTDGERWQERLSSAGGDAL